MTSDGSVDSLLQPFWDDPRRAGVFTDFDGTLAPIVDDPASSAPLPAAVDVLGRLAGPLGRVGVVSGRPVSFLATHLRGLGLVLAGLYGLERIVDDRRVPGDEAELWRSVVEEVAHDGDEGLPGALLVERKGLSVVVHYRTAPHLAGDARAWAEREAARTGLAFHPGRMSYELLPPVATSKGTAVAAMVEGLGAACFLGDDVGDLPAFDALDRLAALGGHAVRVAVESEESPPELLERADLVVDGPEGVVALLNRLADGFW